MLAQGPSRHLNALQRINYHIFEDFLHWNRLHTQGRASSEFRAARSEQGPVNPHLDRTANAQLFQNKWYTNSYHV